MATLDPNTLIGILQGKLGNLVFVRTKEGKIIVRHRPVRDSDRTPGELANQSRLTLANRYVQGIRQQPDEYLPYQIAAKLKGKRACDLARADFAHPPVIHDVNVECYSGKIAEPIRVVAVDDFEVLSVAVTLSDAGGLLLEHGLALPEAGHWLYLTQAAVIDEAAVVIHVTATDRPGHAITKTLHHALLPE